MRNVMPLELIFTMRQAGEAYEKTLTATPLTTERRNKKAAQGRLETA
jgi:hypothetical protein